jgi:hypothetical protein
LIGEEGKAPITAAFGRFQLALYGRVFGLATLVGYEA